MAYQAKTCPIIKHAAQPIKMSSTQMSSMPLKHHLGPKREVKVAHQKQVVATIIGPMGTLQAQQLRKGIGEGGDRAMRREQRLIEETSGGHNAASVVLPSGSTQGAADEGGSTHAGGGGDGEGGGEDDQHALF